MDEGKLPVEDVLIVGGGIAGLATAIALGRRGARPTVLEQASGAVGASIVIGQRAVYALEELGILEQIKALGVAYTEARPPDGVFDHDGNRLSTPRPAFGEDWTLPIDIRIYRPLLSDVMQAAAREAGAELLFGDSYQTIEVSGDGVVAELTTGERREFDLLVAADGVHSELRSRFFPEAGEPAYTGSMSFRMMFEDAPDDWRSGMHVANGNTIVTTMLPGNFFYLAVPNHMERSRVDQADAREIVKTVLANYRPSKMFDEICDRLDENIHVIVAPYEWIFVEPPWHHGRVLLAGDAIHATAPTLGMAGGMALEDAVVLAQELSNTDDVNEALTAYATRRRERAKLVVEASATLMFTHQQRRPPHEEAAMRTAALQKLVAPY